MNFTEGKVREDLMLFLSNLFRVNVKQDQDLPPPPPTPHWPSFFSYWVFKIWKAIWLSFQKKFDFFRQKPLIYHFLFPVKNYI